MTKPIVQSVTFKASPEELFAIFTDSKKHSAATGAKASVSAKAGAKWSAFDGMILGKNLVVVPGAMVVQAWRASHWKDSDLDSILIVNFSNAPGGGNSRTCSACATPAPSPSPDFGKRGRDPTR